MKLIPSCILLLFVLPYGFSQNSNLDAELAQAKQRKLILNILDKQQTRSLEKPTGIRQRVVAQTLKGETSRDSARFSYSGTRGSKFNYNDLGYNTILAPVYEPGIIYPRSMGSFDMLADTISYYRTDTLSYKDYAEYRQDNKLSLIVSEFGPDYPFNRSKSVLTYNGDGFSDVEYYSLYNEPGPFDTSNIERHSYIGAKLITDSIWQKENGQWNLGTVHRYYYSPAGRILIDSTFYIAGTALNVGNVGFFTYYTDGKLQTVTSTSFSGNAIEEVFKDSLGYSSGIDYVTYWHTKREGFSWNSLLLREEIKYPGANGLPDSTTVHRNLNGSESEIVYHYQYNNYDNPEEITRFDDGNTSNVPDETYHFYYETYDDGLAVGELNDDGYIVVYPSPFSRQITLDFKSLLNKNCTFRLLNAVGINVFTVCTAVRNGKVSISFPELPNGLYTLLIQSPDGDFLNKKIIKR